MRQRILTGDRPTGPLHLGHYVGSLANRVKLQDRYELFIIISDYEFLTDHLLDTKTLNKNVEELILDYLAVGIDPKKSVIFIESQVPQISELTMLFSMMVKLSRLKRNPTIKQEMKDRKISNVTYGFLGWPIGQAADILAFRANLVPVGQDQLPHVEQTREIARNFNSLFGKVFPIPQALIGEVKRLPGLDGKKMSKSLHNAIYLKDAPGEVKSKIERAITDPSRIHPFDKGHPEICNVFQYDRAIDPEGAKIRKRLCETGKITCVNCKKEVAQKINEFLKPIRKRREFYKKQSGLIKEILDSGNKKARREAQKTLEIVKEAMHLDYKKLLGN